VSKAGSMGDGRKRPESVIIKPPVSPSKRGQSTSPSTHGELAVGQARATGRRKRPRASHDERAGQGLANRRGGLGHKDNWSGRDGGRGGWYRGGQA
jgi:hypothetical protein